MTFTPEVWDGVLRRLKTELPEFAVETWLAPLEPEFATGEIRLACPSNFHRERIRAHYLESIRRCAAAEAGGDVLVELEVGSSADSTTDLRVGAGADAAEAVADPASEPSGAPRRGDLRRTDTRGEGVAPGRMTGSPRPRTGRHGRRGLPSAATLEPLDDPRKLVADLRVEPARAPLAPATSPRPPVEPAGTSERPPLRPAAPKPRVPVRRAPIQTVIPYSFDSFVVGACNALAREASLALAQGRQLSLNRLYLNGDHGLGKTHLARATVSEAQRIGGSASIRYASAEGFTNDFQAALRSNRTAEFKQRYRRGVRLLVVEDVQFFEGKTQTQLELFHTIQDVIDAGGRVVLTGNGDPHQLVQLDEHVRSQISSGFVADLDPPDDDVRRNILRSKAAAGGFRIPDACLDLIVGQTPGNVRDLEGVLTQIVTTASLLGRPIDLDLTSQCVKKRTAPPTPEKNKPSVLEVIEAVAAFHQTTPEKLACKSRRKEIVEPRQLAMYMAHRYTDASLSEIGRALNREHPSVRNAIERVERGILERAPMRYQVEALSERLVKLLEKNR